MRATAPKLILAAVAAIALAIPLAPSAVASAGQATATIDGRTPELTKKDGGGWTTSLGITNLTDGELIFTLDATGQKKSVCSPTASPASVSGPEHVAVAVTIPVSCSVESKKFAFELTASVDGQTEVFSVTAVEKTADPDPTEWKALAVFPIVLLLSLVFFFVLVWKHVTPKRLAKTTADISEEVAHEKTREAQRKAEHTELPLKAAAEKEAAGAAATEDAAEDLQEDAIEAEGQETWMDVNLAPLANLGATWSFAGSPISSITVGGGLLTAIFASEGSVKALLDVDKAPSLALSVVGVAISTALIAAAPLVLASMAVTPDKATPREQFNSVAGIRVAASFSLAAALGLLWVVYRTGVGLELSQAGDRWLKLAFFLAAALTVVYGIRGTFQTLRLGLLPPRAAGPTDTQKAIELFEKILKQLVPSGQRAAVTSTAQQIESDLPEGATLAEATSMAATAYFSAPSIDNAKVIEALDLATEVGNLLSEPAQAAPAEQPTAMI